MAKKVYLCYRRSEPFWQSPDKISGDTVKAWLRAGANTLPLEFAARVYGKDGTCTALIYEFERNGSAVKMVESAITGKQHLEKAGLLPALEQVN